MKHDCITVGISKQVDPTRVPTPSEHNTCMTLYNVGSTSKTLGRRCINVIQMFCVCWEGGLSLKHCTFRNVGSMLGQRRRRWPNIKTALGECLVGVVSSLVIRLLHQPHCTVC